MITSGFSVIELLNQSYTSFSDAFLYRIGVDEWLRVPSAEDVFSIGDCSGYLESTGKPVLPALAQVSFIQFQQIQKPLHQRLNP